MKIIYKFLLTLDRGVYNLIVKAFDLFLNLAKIKIFDLSNAQFGNLIKRAYILISVVMLFVLSYALLRGIINPSGKGIESAGKTILNTVKVIIILTLIPWIFSFAFRIQTVILQYNTIGKIIIGSGSNPESEKEVLQRGGFELAHTVLDAFLYVEDGKSTDCYDGVHRQIEEEQNFTNIGEYAECITDNTVHYDYFISLLGGGFVLYLLASYCISLGLRIAKLAFYEIIAPIPLMMSILPSSEDKLNKWVKIVITTFLEVFIRIAIIYIMMFVLRLASEAIGNLGDEIGNKFLIKAIICMGIVAFAKKAPEFLSEATGIDTKNMNLGIKDQLKQGGLFTAGAMMGAGAQTTVQRITSGIQRYKEARKQDELKAAGLDGKEKTKFNKARRWRSAGRIAGIVGSTLTGGFMSTVSGYSAGKNAESFGEAKDTASQVAYKAAQRKAESIRTYGSGIKSQITGRAKRAVEGIKTWAGISSSIEGLKREYDEINNISGKESAITDATNQGIDKMITETKDDLNINGYTRNGLDTLIKKARAIENLSDREVFPIYEAFRKAFRNQYRDKEALSKYRKKYNDLDDIAKAEIDDKIKPYLPKDDVSTVDMRVALQKNADEEAVQYKKNWGDTLAKVALAASENKRKEILNGLGVEDDKVQEVCAKMEGALHSAINAGVEYRATLTDALNAGKSYINLAGISIGDLQGDIDLTNQKFKNLKSEMGKESGRIFAEITRLRHTQKSEESEKNDK